MKKTILIVIAFATSLSASAQQITNKKGNPVLPEKGDWSIGFDAVPFLNFAGNFFNSSNKAPSADFNANHPMTFCGLYVKESDVMYRFKLRLGITSDKQDTLVAKIGSSNANETVADESIHTTTNIALGAGIQKYKGKGRLKGLYGAEAILSFSGDKTSYSYGNALSTENQESRLKSSKLGTGIGFQVRAFMGIEYFFAPKMSVSAEYGWGPTIQAIGQGEVQKESWNGSGVTSVITNTGKSSHFSTDVDNSAGAINLHFYF
jgi:hypothetical protein